MNQELSALDLHYLIKELQFLRNSKVNKIYQSNKRNFYFRFFVSNNGNQMVKIQIPKLIYITTKLRNLQERPMGFCTFLRKYLTNAWVKEIRQHGFDRVIEILFTKTEFIEDKRETKEYILVLEMFNPGNMILCKDDYTILSPLAGKDWSNRSIRKGLKYEFPPEMEDVYKIKYERFKELVQESDKESIVKTLAMDLGLGGVYAEEVCFDVVDKTESKLNEKEIKKLFESFVELINRKTQPVVYGKKKGFPFLLKSFSDEYEEFESFGKVIDSMIIERIVVKENKFEKIIEKQTENLGKIEEQIKENTEYGNIIYNNYMLVKELFEDIQKIRKKEGWDAVKEKYKDSKIVKKMDSSTGEIILEL